MREGLASQPSLVGALVRLVHACAYVVVVQEMHDLSSLVCGGAHAGHEERRRVRRRLGFRADAELACSGRGVTRTAEAVRCEAAGPTGGEHGVRSDSCADHGSPPIGYRRGGHAQRDTKDLRRKVKPRKGVRAPTCAQRATAGGSSLTRAASEPQPGQHRREGHANSARHHHSALGWTCGHVRQRT
jgi:hypothetical protein